MAEFLTHPSSRECHQYLQVQLKRIQSRTAEKKWQHQIFPISVYEDFFCHQWSNLVEIVLLQAFMHVIITWKYEKNGMKKSCEKVATSFFPIITLSVAIETSSRIWLNFKLIQALRTNGSVNAHLTICQVLPQL